MGSKASSPKVPSYQAQMLSALNAQAKIAPKLLSLEEQYGPAFTEMKLKGLENTLFGTGDQQGYLGVLSQIAPQYRAMEAADIAALRQEELKQLGQFAPQYVQTFRQAAGTEGLLSGLKSQAEQQLAAGTELTPEETRQAQQASRAAFANRGLGLTNRAVGAEILNQYGLGQQRLQQRQSLAGQVASQLESSGMPQYYQTMMGLTGVSDQYSGTGFFNPESQMAMDISAQKSQGKAAASAANAANKSAMIGAGAGTVVLGAVLI